MCIHKHFHSQRPGKQKRAGAGGRKKSGKSEEEGEGSKFAGELRETLEWCVEVLLPHLNDSSRYNLIPLQ